jgi:D-inositol-3-phosphate glycosyltransferase
VRRLAVLSVHTSPLAQPGTGDSGGMNVYVRELFGSLARAGVDTTIYVRRSDSGPGEVAVEPNLRVVAVDAGAPGLDKADLPAVLPQLTDAMQERLTDERPDAIHANYWLSGVVGHELKHRLDLPLLTTFHTLGRVKALGGDPEPAHRIEAERGVVACSDLILANTRVEREQLVGHYGADPGRVVVVPPAVDHAFFSPGSRAGARQALGLGSGPLLLFVGRIQALKGLDLGVEALARLERTDARLVVVGGPSGREGTATQAAVERRAVELGVADRIVWVAPQPHHLLASYYRAADVCIVPSRSESFGLVALEAMACGTPVIASDVGGLRHLVDHGGSGYLVAGRDPAVFAAYVNEVLGDAGLATRLAAGGERVAASYRWSASAERLLEQATPVAAAAPVSCL